MIRWDAEEPFVIAFTTRVGGISSGPYESLNLGRLTDDEPSNVAENRRLACTAIGADLERLAMNRQVHGPEVRRAVAGDRGRNGDGLWTDEPNLPLLVLTADCLPVVLTAGNGRPALAVLHVGRLGLLAGIVDRGVAAVGTPATAIVGPGIGPCCYEVGEDIRESYRSRFGPRVVRARKLDLWGATEQALREAGVARVERMDLCTACAPERFFSHRRDRGVTGRQGVIAYIA